jgi:hypothetical protein
MAIGSLHGPSEFGQLSLGLAGCSTGIPDRHNIVETPTPRFSQLFQAFGAGYGTFGFHPGEFASVFFEFFDSAVSLLPGPLQTVLGRLKLLGELVEGF